MVKFIESEGEWMALMETSKDKLVVVDFTASWCGPCQMIAPKFQAMSEKYTNVVFVKVDVDAQEKIAGMCGIRAMPTFQFYKNGAKVDELCGANEAGIIAKVEALA